MKKRFLAIVIFTSVTAVFLSVSVAAMLFGAENAIGGARTAENDDVTILVTGLDEAAKNTDVMLLLSFSRREGVFRFLQIPRDTYWRTEDGEGKINGIFPTLLSKYDKKEAAEKLTACISSCFGIEIDAYAILGMHALETLVDSIGGVYVNLPQELSYNDGEKQTVLSRGKQLLFGSAAVAFVRHRSSYAQGDLGRLDAQMRFLAGLFNRLRERRSFQEYKDIYQKNRANLLTNLKEKDIINLMMGYIDHGAHFDAQIMRLPGEACHIAGEAWYFVPYRAACEKMFSQLFGATEGSFDPKKQLVREGNEVFRNIYESFDASYRIFSAQEAENATVLQK